MPIMYTMKETTKIGLTLYKKSNLILLITIITCIYNILIMILLVPVLGGMGAAISYGSSYILYAILQMHISQKYYSLSINFIKFYIILFFIICFSFYSSFLKWSFYNFIVGLLLLIGILLFYKNSLVEFSKYCISQIYLRHNNAE